MGTAMQREVWKTAHLGPVGLHLPGSANSRESVPSTPAYYEWMVVPPLWGPP